MKEFLAVAPAGAGGCHLGYYKAFVCDSLNFVDRFIQPERGQIDCGTGIAQNPGEANAGSAPPAAPSSNSGSSGGSGGSSGSGGSGGSGNSGSGSNSSGSGGSGGSSAPTQTVSAQQKCTNGGGSWADRDGDGKSSCSYPPSTSVCDSWWSGVCSTSGGQ